MKQIGKIGKININANKKINKMFQNKGIDYCEVDYPHDCNPMWLTFAHRHKRVFYRGNSELLSDYNQVIMACINVHAIMEKDAELTKEIFDQLRGEEK